MDGKYSVGRGDRLAKNRQNTKMFAFSYFLVWMLIGSIVAMSFTKQICETINLFVSLELCVIIRIGGQLCVLLVAMSMFVRGIRRNIRRMRLRCFTAKVNPNIRVLAHVYTWMFIGISASAGMLLWLRGEYISISREEIKDIIVPVVLGYYLLLPIMSLLLPGFSRAFRQIMGNRKSIVWFVVIAVSVGALWQLYVIFQLYGN